MNSAQIRQAVRKFRVENRLKVVSSETLEKALEQLGYTLIFFNPAVNDEDTEYLITFYGLKDMIAVSKGFIYADKRSRLIFINEKLNEKERLQVLAHETGHIVLGHMLRSPIFGQDTTEEYEAHEFMRCLLEEQPADRLWLFLRFHPRLSLALICTLAGALVLSFVLLRSPRPSAPEEAGASGIITLQDLVLPLPVEQVKGGFHFLILKNGSNSTVRIQTASEAVGESGSLLGSAERLTVPVAPGCTIVVEEDYHTTEDIDSFRTAVEAVPAEEASLLPDLTYETVINQDGALVSMTNRGSLDVRSLTGYALFFREGRLVCCDYAFFGDSSDVLAPWMPEKRQLYASEEFDSAEFYILSYDE